MSPIRYGIQQLVQPQPPDYLQRPAIAGLFCFCALNNYYIFLQIKRATLFRSTVRLFYRQLIKIVVKYIVQKSQALKIRTTNYRHSNDPSVNTTPNTHCQKLIHTGNHKDMVAIAAIASRLPITVGPCELR